MQAARIFLVAAIAVLGVTPKMLVAQGKTGNLALATASMSEGLGAVAKGDLPRAREAFGRVVKQAPGVEAGHAALGSVLLAMGEFEGSARELGVAHRLAANDAAVDLNLARARVGLGRYAEAVALFQEGLGQANAPALSAEETVAYATALTRTGESAAAADLLARAVEGNPDSATLNDALGTVLAGGGQTDRALPLFEHAVATDAADGRAQYHLSAALLAVGRGEEAIAPAKLALEAMPGSFERQLQLGRALSAAHRDEEALGHLHRAAELAAAAPATADDWYALALALEASGDARGALRMFARATAPGVSGGTFDRTSALTNEALAHVQVGDAEGALPLYGEALRLGPDSATLREDYGVAYLQKADLTHGLEQFGAGLRLEPENARLHYDLGLAYKLKDDLPAAVAEFERAAALDPSLPDPAYTLGVILMQQGRFSEAAAQLRRAVALQPTNGDAWALLGSVLKDSGEAAEAQEALQRAIALQPDQPSLHIQLAGLDAQAGQREEAAAERKIAAELSRAANNRQRASFALKSGRALMQEDKLAEAEAQLATAVRADPTLAEPHELLAAIYGRQGKRAEAALERRRAAEMTAEAKQP